MCKYIYIYCVCSLCTMRWTRVSLQTSTSSGVIRAYSLVLSLQNNVLTLPIKALLTKADEDAVPSKVAIHQLPSAQHSIRPL